MIKNNYKSGEINFNLNKNKMTEKEEKEKKEEHPTEYKNKWYIIKGDENLGPFNDYDLFKKTLRNLIIINFILLIFFLILYFFNISKLMGIGDWGLGIGD